MDKSKIKELEKTLKLAKDAVAAEARFKALPAAQKRVAIAKDVIASLRTKQLVAQTGVFVDLDLNGSVEDDDFQTALLMGQQCTVCALGSLFTCAVKVKNKVDSVDANEAGRSDIKDYLKGIFTTTQLGLIESAFERCNHMEDHDAHLDYVDVERVYTGPLKSAVDFGNRYVTDHNRMVAIMTNIIKNEGTFKP